MNFEEVIENLNGIQYDDDFENEVINAFDDYQYEGVTEVILSKQQYNASVDYEAYINHEDAPIACIKIKHNKVVAW